MSDNQYIKKLQRARGKSLVTTRNIILIIILSGAVYAGFYMEYGTIDDAACEGTCENLHSLRSWVLGFLMIFATIIAAGALVGALVGFFKWSRKDSGGTLSGLVQGKKDDTPN